MKILTKLLVVILLIGNIAFSLYLYLQFQSLKTQEVPPTSKYVFSDSPTVTPQGTIDLSSYATKSYVDTTVAGVSGAKTVVSTEIKKSPQASYISLATNFTTQALDWVDVPDTDFYLDLVTDYGEQASVYWEAFLHEEHGNGNAEVRLMDVTHGIVVVGSELSTNNASSTLVTSGNLAIWKGKNLYRVQMKSQKGFIVFFDTGRVKISN